MKGTLASSDPYDKGVFPFAFFGLVFALSVPFWLVGSLTGGTFLPGLPVSSAMVLCPALAAALLVGRVHGRRSLKAFALRAVDCGRMPIWAWAVALLTMPMVMAISAVWQTALGQHLPQPALDVFQLAALLALFLVAATLEELGWTGYATGPLMRAYGWIGAGLIIGAVSAVWHLIPLIQAGRAWDWIAWWALGSVARRVIMVWFYWKGGRSLFAVSLFHAMSNVTWMAFPVMGSHYDPMVTGLVLAGAVLSILAATSFSARVRA